MSATPPCPSAHHARHDASSVAPVEVLESKALFGRADELIIRHAGHDYRLRITRQNKLILTK